MPAHGINLGEVADLHQRGEVLLRQGHRGEGRGVVLGQGGGHGIEGLGQQAGRRHRRRGRHERAGVGVLRVLEDGPRVAGLHHAAAVHHHELLRPLGREAEVMGDQQHGTAELAGHLVDLVQDHLLHRHVQGGGRLVRDQQLRPARQADGDQHALAQAARELVRVLLGPPRGLGDAGALHHLDDGGPHVLLRRHAVGQQGLPDLLTHPGHGVEVGHRVLRHQPDPAATDAAHPRLGQAHELLAREADGACRDPAVAGQQADRGHRGGGLARAGLAHDRQRAPGREREGRALHGLHGALLGGELHVQVADLQQRGAGRGDRGCRAGAGRAVVVLGVHGQRLREVGSRASRRDSPSRVKPSAVMAMHRPGRNASHGLMPSSACA